jgi:vacuolar-type H+-ATPase subunit I/STV1
MTKPIATSESVQAAADQLHAEGREITIDTIRERIGGGSETTVLRHLQRWRETPRNPIAAPPLPSSVNTAFDGFVARLWTEAWAHAARDIEAAKSRAAAEVDAALRQRTEVQALSERHEAELEKLRAEAGERMARLAQLEAQASTAEALRQRAALAESELAACRQALEHCTTTARDGEQVCARLTGETQALRAQLSATERLHRDERHQHLSRITDLERREAVAADAATRLRVAEQELSACRAELAACRVELALHRRGDGAPERAMNGQSATAALSTTLGADPHGAERQQAKVPQAAERPTDRAPRVHRRP